MSTFEDPPVHPIAEEVLGLMRDGGPGEEPAVIDAAGKKALAARIDGYLSSAELFDVVETVLYTSHILETELGSPRAARVVLRLVERPPVLMVMKRMNRHRVEARAEAVHDGAQAFGRFAELPKVSIEVSRPPPPGSVPLALAFPRRL